MNGSDVPRITRTGQALSKALDKHGTALFKATLDWQSPLRSAGAPGCKGEHADPTPSQVITPDPLALAHQQYVALLDAKDRADVALAAFIHQHAPIDADRVNRGRVNTVATCLVCAGPAFPVRRGMCDTDYRAWIRANRPDLEGFRRTRHRETEAATARIHEHEVTASHGTPHHP